MVNKKPVNKVAINKSWCKDCSICEEFCPQRVFDKNTNGRVIVKNPQKCTLCGLCQLRCPDFAIDLEGDVVE